MNKGGLPGKFLLSSILIIFLLNFVSAVSYYYNRFSLTGLFDSISSENMILFFFFIIVLVMVGVVLKRVPLFVDKMGNPSRGPIAVLALSIATLATYGIYQSGFGLEGLFSNIGVSGDLLYPVLSVILIIAFVIMLWQFRIGWSLIIIGLLTLIVVFFTDAIYEEGLASLIGIILLLVGLWIKSRSNQRLMAAGQYVGSNYNWQKEKSQWSGGTYVLILGIFATILGFLWNGILIFVGLGLIIIGIWRIIVRRRNNPHNFQIR